MENKDTTITDSDLPSVSNEPLALSKVEQAALLLLGMGEEIAAGVLRNFSRDEVQKVAKVMSTLSDIKTTQAKDVIEDFFNDFKQHSGIHGASKNFIDNMLNSALDGNIAKGLVADLYGDEIKNKMQKLQWISAEILMKSIANEHAKMQSVFLAYLPAETSSEIFTLFSEKTRIDLLYRITQIEELEQNVADDLLELIERCATEYTENKNGSLKGIKQVVDIINHYGGDKSAIMHSLKEKNSDVVQQIENDMFDFYVIANQTEQTLELIHQHITHDLWAVALKGATPEFKQDILKSLPKRLAADLESEIKELGGMPISVVKNAQAEIMETLRDLNRRGVIELILYTESVVE
ncbi:flagellar motor switch protein FliG [Psychromonas ingrahamii 37]|uniref:Flagellar motor switch protein FliG n=2 Tax=Psychromonas ingrahamii TaxID=357794 RepID=A1T0I2_PSYIN|nr:flagellar motor switch protein FliG [Psychromonas ingrahamii 37]